MSLIKAAFFLETIANKEARAAYKMVFGSTKPEEIRDSYFKKLVAHVYEHVPYYRQVMQERSLTPADFKTTADVVKFPLLTKDIIRKEKDNLLADNIPPAELIHTRSGGTTGEPITSVLNRKAYYIEYFAYWRGITWMGWNKNMGIIKLFGGRMGTPAPRNLKNRFKNFLHHQLFLPAFELNENNVEHYIEKMRAHGESILVGYAHALYNLACFAEGKNLAGLRIAQVFSTAEQMPEAWANRISKVFGCPVKSFYGCGEINSLGFQLAQNGAYKIPVDHAIIESVHEQGVAPDSLAITGLHNYAQPLIRYVNGDMGTVENGMITNLLGRSSDMLLTSSGQHVSPSIIPHLVFVTGLPVRKYQMIQHAPNLFEFRYEGESGALTKENIQTLTDIMMRHFGNDIKLEPIQTSDFILTSQMKHRVAINQIQST